MTRLVFVFVLLLAVAVSGQQGPTETLSGLKPAPGLAVTLFAAEPDVQNPTDLTVDERGRVWVLEGRELPAPVAHAARPPARG